MLLNEEISRWREFRKILSDDDKEVFDEVMNRSKLFASASSCALRTNVFESLCMAIILDHQRRLEKLATEFEQLHIGASNEKI
jgi:hypothetical protein